MVSLVFNEGYGGRPDLAGEAIRLARAVADLALADPSPDLSLEGAGRRLPGDDRAARDAASFRGVRPLLGQGVIVITPRRSIVRE